MNSYISQIAQGIVSSDSSSIPGMITPTEINALPVSWSDSNHASDILTGESAFTNPESKSLMAKEEIRPSSYIENIVQLNYGSDRRNRAQKFSAEKDLYAGKNDVSPADPLQIKPALSPAVQNVQDGIVSNKQESIIFQPDASSKDAASHLEPKINDRSGYQNVQYLSQPGTSNVFQNLLPTPESHSIIKREEPTPKLVIGKITVEIINTTAKVQATPRPTQQAPISTAPRSGSNINSKLIFGLGQL